MLLPTCSLAMSSACCKKTFCAVVVSYGHKAGHECGLVVVQKCPNGLCSKHCPYKGGCDLHPTPPCHHVTDASDVAHWIEPLIMTLEPDSFPSKVHLPVPLPTYRAGYDLQLTPSGFGPPLSFIPYVPLFPVVPSITSIAVPTKIICPPPSTSLMTNADHTKQRAVHLGLDDTVAN